MQGLSSQDSVLADNCFPAAVMKWIQACNLTNSLPASVQDAQAGAAQHTALRAWLEAATRDVGADTCGEAEQMEFMRTEFSLRGNNFVEQDAGKILAAALGISVYVMSICEGGDFVQVTAYGGRS